MVSVVPGSSVEGCPFAALVRGRSTAGLTLSVLALSATSAWATPASPYASEVVSYVQGSGVGREFNVPANALGEPSRSTGERSNFFSAVTPFNPAFESDELVSVGRAGELVVRFAEPITNDPLNPFGIDLLVFGNSGYVDVDFPNARAGGLFGGGDGGVISVSSDGVSWSVVPSLQADGAFPTLGYLDLPSAYGLPGSVPSDFTRPVDPAFDPLGKTFAEIVTGYAGSGGGVGVDIGSLGLSEISFVRVSNASDAVAVPEIDGFADVAPIPAPSVASVGLVVACTVWRRRRVMRKS
ncbi:MAG: hypothetical protein SFZ23_04645 [Planctomycetota bacterium]|nr:hypothetical protein [Planctomycetota bacterium]